MQRQAETLEQYKRSDEANLKAIETLEANIWEATDSKNQLLVQISNLESQCEDLRTKLKAAEDLGSADKSQLSLLQSDIASKSAELENLQALYNSCSDELTKLQSAQQHTGSFSSETHKPQPVPESSPAAMHGLGTGAASESHQEPNTVNFFQTPASDQSQTQIQSVQYSEFHVSGSHSKSGTKPFPIRGTRSRWPSALQGEGERERRGREEGSGGRGVDCVVRPVSLQTFTARRASSSRWAWPLLAWRRRRRRDSPTSPSPPPSSPPPPARPREARRARAPPWAPPSYSSPVTDGCERGIYATT